jgi:hypothetical protein
MVVVEGDGPAQHDQSVLGHAAEGGVEDATADLVEIDVDPVRAQFLKPGGQVVGAAVEAELVHDPRALLVGAHDTHDPAPLDVGRSSG